MGVANGNNHSPLFSSMLRFTQGTVGRLNTDWLLCWLLCSH